MRNLEGVKEARGWRWPRSPLPGLGSSEVGKESWTDGAGPRQSLKLRNGRQRNVQFPREERDLPSFVGEGFRGDRDSHATLEKSCNLGGGLGLLCGESRLN